MREDGFLSLFPVIKPVIGVLHCGGDSDRSILDSAVQEADIYEQCGIDAVLVENYFCEPRQMEMVLKQIAKNHGKLLYGVNLLGDDVQNFQLAREYDCDFMQIDSVCGHLAVEEDKQFHEFIQKERKNCQAKLIGGVRFKYQSYRSGRSLDEDLKIGISRCDAIAVTGEATGLETDLGKIKAFRDIINDFPLIVAAGITPENAREQIITGDACIVGSYFKEGHDVENALKTEYVQGFMDVIRNLRKSS